MRKPFQGVTNIIKFNWPFYAIAMGLLVAAIPILYFNPYNIGAIVLFAAMGLATFLIVSTIASYYIYDLSDVYNISWLSKIKPNEKIININAGFDETSELIRLELPKSKLFVFDFYDPLKHTEPSIERARKMYERFPDTQSIRSDSIPLTDSSVDIVITFLSAHEIRNHTERAIFFSEAKRVLKPSGNIIVVEHLRDFSNFIAYSIGCFHFHSRKTWLKTFTVSNLKLVSEEKINPFITKFILTHGTTS